MVTTVELDGGMVCVHMQHSPADDCAGPGARSFGAPGLFPLCKGFHRRHMPQQPASCHTHTTSLVPTSHMQPCALQMTPS